MSLPERRYDVAASLFATTLEAVADELPPERLTDAAHETGRAVGRSARQQAGSRPSRARRRLALLDTLRDRGYEPRETSDGEIRFGTARSTRWSTSTATSCAG